MQDTSYNHLYLIGNGFDIFTGLKTKYSDFRKWLERNYVFVYENLTLIYGADGEWWNDFENQLGRLNFARYTSMFPSKEKTLKEIMEEHNAEKEHREKGDGVPSLYTESKYAKRLEGLLDILQYCYEKWVYDEQQCYINYNKAYIEKENSLFINFNYTDTLEIMYDIPEEHIIHIHGRATNHERLIFGHDFSFLSYDTHNDDEQQIAEILSMYQKNPYYFIHHFNLLEKIKNVEHIHVLGLSLSDVDFPYLEWLVRHTSNNCDWEISWFSDEDKRRINKFISENPQINSRLNKIQLQKINDG